MKKIGLYLNYAFKVLCSLKLAVLIILAIAGSIATGTILESIYDTPTSQYWVYRATWFHGLMFLLGVEIFCVAMSRYPWKPRHIPFLFAHAGIIILLFGSLLTDRKGLDGTLRIGEGELGTAVDVFQNQLVVSDHQDVHTIPIEWIPPTVNFKSFSVQSRGLPYDIKVEKFITHADVDINFLPKEYTDLKTPPQPAAEINISGGPMQISQDYWVWSGGKSWNVVQAGPAVLAMDIEPPRKKGQPTLILLRQSDGSLKYKSYSSQDKLTEGRIKKSNLEGAEITTGWSNSVHVKIKKWIDHAAVSALYKPSRVQYTDAAPTSAIFLTTGTGGEDQNVWLGLGEKATLVNKGKSIEVGYFPKRVILPFSVKLNRFQIDHYEGTRNPSSYSSNVDVMDGAQSRSNIVISMNEPLEYKNITFYQSSYEDAFPRPTVSIFSVNQDPGRYWKYNGSILIVLGSILLFLVKYKLGQRLMKIFGKEIP
jgi:hypothetical protein